MPKRPCLDCGTPTNGSRCPTHHRPRNTTDEHRRRQLLTAWRQHHGDWCPGAADLNHPPHPSTDLTVDHIVHQAHGGTLTDGWRILCRSANSARRDR